MKKTIIATFTFITLFITHISLAASLNTSIKNHTGHPIKISYSMYSRSDTHYYHEAANLTIAKDKNPKLPFRLPTLQDKDYAFNLTIDIFDKNDNRQTSHKIFHLVMKPNNIDHGGDDPAYPATYTFVDKNPMSLDLDLGGAPQTNWFWRLFGY